MRSWRERISTFKKRANDHKNHENLSRGLPLKKKFMIRADASPAMGAGHLMRMIALGQMLSDAGQDVHFLTIPNHQDTSKRLSDEGFRVYEFQSPFTEVGDLARLVAIAEAIRPNWIVIDGYHFSGNYEKSIKTKIPSAKLLRVDDVPAIHHYADVLLNQNFGAQASAFSTEPGTVLLFGPEFLLLRREFREGCFGRKSMLLKSGKMNLLVSLGGGSPMADEANLKIAGALHLLQGRELSLTFLAGEMSANKEVLRERLPDDCFLIDYSANMAREMSHADVAVVAAGSTMWELMFMGVPFAALSLTDAQRAYLAILGQSKLCLDLGFSPDLDSAQIAKRLELFLDDVSSLNDMRMVCLDLVKPNTSGRRLLDVLLS